MQQCQKAELLPTRVHGVCFLMHNTECIRQHAFTQVKGGTDNDKGQECGKKTRIVKFHYMPYSVQYAVQWRTVKVPIPETK